MGNLWTTVKMQWINNLKAKECRHVGVNEYTNKYAKKGQLFQR